MVTTITINLWTTTAVHMGVTTARHRVHTPTNTDHTDMIDICTDIPAALVYPRVTEDPTVIKLHLLLYNIAPHSLWPGRQRRRRWKDSHQHAPLSQLVGIWSFWIDFFDKIWSWILDKLTSWRTVSGLITWSHFQYVSFNSIAIAALLFNTH